MVRHHLVLCSSHCSGLSIPCKNGKIKDDVDHNDTASTAAARNNNNTEIICLCDILKRM